MNRSASAIQSVALVRAYSSVASVAIACFNSFVEPVLDSDINSRATWVRRLSAISSSPRDLLKSRPLQADLTSHRSRGAIGGNLVVLHLLG
jgi:hypothetical protein